MLERALIAHGSPTLAGLKPGSLFTVRASDGFEEEFQAVNGTLHPKGLTLTVLRRRADSALMHLYRTADLERCLSDAEAQAFLRECGYSDFCVEGALASLRGRLNQSDGFPHEIGVFLGYPLSDVIGFIQNGGQNCLCCGCWKVYSNEQDARRAFARFRRCREVYERLFASGYPLSSLAVGRRSA